MVKAPIKKNCAICSEGALSEETTQRWFCRPRSGSFDVKDAPRGGRPITEKVDEFIAKS